jgi:hypothetical protein
VVLDEPRDVQRMQTVNADQENVPDARIAREPGVGAFGFGARYGTQGQQQSDCGFPEFHGFFLCVVGQTMLAS